MRDIIFLEPVFKAMIWGGTKLQSEFGYQIPSEHTGECWAVSAHRSGDCQIKNGVFAGKSLGCCGLTIENSLAMHREKYSRFWLK